MESHLAIQPDPPLGRSRWAAVSVGDRTRAPRSITFPGTELRIAWYGLPGLALVGCAWLLSWSHFAPWSEWGFFPLWLGYILTVDAMVRPKLQRSLLGSGVVRVVGIFAISAAAWWLFELFNLRTGNWRYLQPSPVGPVRFTLEATLDFSTVLPAVFETTALLHVLLPGHSTSLRPDMQLSNRAARVWFGIGVVSLVLPLLWPQYFFPLLWLCLFFLVDPINARLGNPSLLASAHAGRWRPLIVLATAGLSCGFFWEMWNSNSMPKWVYNVPWIPQRRLFEMPLLGYGGYLAFALECFAAYTLAVWVLRAGATTRVADALPYVPLIRVNPPG